MHKEVTAHVNKVLLQSIVWDWRSAALLAATSINIKEELELDQYKSEL